MSMQTAEPGQFRTNNTPNDAAPAATELVQVSMIVRDARGFTHYYEEISTTPASVRDAFDLMARAGGANAF